VELLVTAAAAAALRHVLGLASPAPSQGLGPSPAANTHQVFAPLLFPSCCIRIWVVVFGSDLITSLYVFLLCLINSIYFLQNLLGVHVYTMSSTGSAPSCDDVLILSGSEMAETVFTPSLEGMKHVKAENGVILTKPFLDVCKQILPVLGNSFASLLAA
jgi:hypothetical protein